MPRQINVKSFPRGLHFSMNMAPKTQALEVKRREGCLKIDLKIKMLKNN